MVNKAANDMVDELVKGGLVVLSRRGIAYVSLHSRVMERDADRPVRNQGGNACKTSPASARSAITVGTTAINDEVADYSNRGCCVDILLPGRVLSPPISRQQLRHYRALRWRKTLSTLSHT